ncbi:MAG: signal peptidase I [Saccharothrix sp.]|nr:signal peptidase I [Saccharothrix sp.]
MTTTQPDSSFFIIPLIIVLAVAVLMIAATWRIFTKAGRPGWAAIIPIYNIYVQLKIIGRPGWWLILLIIPVVNVVISLIIAIDLAKSFGKGTGFGVVGLWLFTIIGYPMLGFGDATYRGPAAA